MDGKPALPSGRYLKYALGEIILVVIGILIALSINNWNSERVQNQKLSRFYQNLSQEFNAVLIDLETQSISTNDALIFSLQRSLELIKNRPANYLDSLEYHLGALGTAWVVELTIPVFEEFKSSGLMNEMNNESLKKAFVQFEFLSKQINAFNQFVRQQYAITLEPYILTHMNYSNIALESYRKNLVKGGPETDFEELSKSMELWNMLTIKLETQTSGEIKMKNLAQHLRVTLELLENLQ
jgi:hypothetical protein